MLKHISRREEFDLFTAWLAISLSFTIIKIAPGGLLSSLKPVNPADAMIFFGISLVTVGIGFVLHEMAHKFTAMKYGFWAEFRKDNTMLLVAVVLASLVGVVFAAPGATVIYPSSIDGRGLSREQNGKISAAGPTVNLLLCIPFTGLLIYGVNGLSPTHAIMSMVGIFGIQINSMIAAFNMLPVSILDGKKVIYWNIGVFLVLIILSFGILLGSFYMF